MNEVNTVVPRFLRKFSGTTLIIFLLAIAPAWAQGQSASELASEALRNRAQSLGLSANDLASLRARDEFPSAKSGVTHVILQQEIAGIGIYNAQANLAILPSGRIIIAGNRLVPDLEGKTISDRVSLTYLQALNVIMNDLQIGPLQSPVLLEQPAGAEQKALLNEAGISEEPIPVKLEYVADSTNQIRLAWDISILPAGDVNWWSYKIDAATGQILDKLNWAVECHWGPETDEVTAPAQPFELEFEPKPLTPWLPNPPLPGVNAPDSYTVFPEPVESPNHGSRSVMVNPADATASPFGWHDTNGATGAEFTITRGNNVHAQEDQDGNNGTGYAPDGGATLDFNYPLNLNNAPSTYTDAAVTNLFYWNNLIHDVWYHYGFDEPSGNFQSNNYGNGGAANDYVRADAQDGSGINNANFATPTDGNRPRMQMFLWNGSSTTIFEVTSPSGIAGFYNAVPAAFGPSLTSTPITGPLVLADDGTANPSEACNALINGTAMNGNIALIDRGSCTFVSKVQNAQNAGAIACVVCNNVAGNPITMGGTTGAITIPSIMISQTDCAILKAQLGTGVNVSLSATGSSVDKDGDFDNGIIAHEYGHGISNRLVGGPSNSSCLGNQEQMGEGWSDWLGLIMTIEPGDRGTDARGIGTFAISQSPAGGGIRPSPYSTDLNINGWTYGDITNTGAISRPHGVGFLWCNMLWEMTWSLIDLYGFDPDLINGTGGNNIAMQLVIDGLKLTPCNPGFVDGRDAILRADTLNYGGIHSCLIWEAFAKRGLGVSASQGSSGSRTDGAEAFDTPLVCQNFPVVWTDVTARVEQDNIRVIWEVAREEGNDKFIVERYSAESKTFASIGEVAGGGDSQVPADYSFLDTRAEPGVNYVYRIKQVDHDGAFTYSDRVAAMVPLSAVDAQVIPNPATSGVTIRLPQAGQGQTVVTLLDAMGRKIQESTIPAGQSSLDWNISSLSEGYYLIRISQMGELKFKQLIINR